MKQKLMQRKPRLAGLIFLLMGTGLGYWQAWLPIKQADTHEHEIFISLRGVTGSIAFILLGLSLLLAGPRIAPYFAPK